MVFAMLTLFRRRIGTMVGSIDDLEEKVVIIVETIGLAPDGLVLSIRPLKNAV